VHGHRLWGGHLSAALPIHMARLEVTEIVGGISLTRHWRHRRVA